MKLRFTVLLTLLFIIASGSDAMASKAKLKDPHTAVAPKRAPVEVKRMIQAGNRISRLPYIWGGGHRKWNDRGYDCSGAVSYVLRAGGYLKSPMASGALTRWGKKGRNRWLTVYANRGHAYLVIAGLRFDTGYITDGDKSGPGWSKKMRPNRGFTKRKAPRMSRPVRNNSTVGSGGFGPSSR